MSSRSLSFALFAALAVFGCTEPAASPDLSNWRAGRISALNVSAADPAWGRPGESGKTVTITGSGFQPGATVVWQRSGLVDPHVNVRSVTYVSSTQLKAVIDIALDAQVALYDVAVMNSDRKQGIGTEMFEVTQAISIGGPDGTLARGVNDLGQIVGRMFIGKAFRAFYWSNGTGMIDIGGTQAWGIDETGTAIVGQMDSYAVVWAWNGSSWPAPVALPRAATATGGRPSAVSRAADGTLIVAGHETDRNGQRPIRWTKAPGGTWIRTALAWPAGSGSQSWVEDVNSAGQVVGAVQFGSAVRAVLWEADGTVKIVGPAGSTAEGINEGGQLIVGAYNSRAAYYALSNGQWSAPVMLAGTCARAMAVDQNGNIAGTNCNNGRAQPAAWTAGSYVMIPLSGFGDRDEVGEVEDMSPSGKYIVGSAKLGNIRLGAYWQIF